MAESRRRPASCGYELDEQAVLERLARGDAGALDALMQVYWDRLVRFAAALLGSIDAAEDVVQLTFMWVWQRRDQLAVRESLKALIYGVTRNIALNERKHHGSRARLFDRIRRRQPSPATPLELVVGDELERAARAALEAMPPRRRQAFVLCRFHDMSHREAAEVLGVSKRTVTNQVTAAVRYLRDALQPHLES